LTTAVRATTVIVFSDPALVAFVMKGGIVHKEP
jgi:hypothetical protein